MNYDATLSRNRVQKYNYFLNNWLFYEKKFVFLIISLKINNTTNAVLQMHSVAKQHSLYRIIRNSTENLHHIYCVGKATARHSSSKLDSTLALRHIMEDVDHVVVSFKTLDEAIDILLLLGRKFSHSDGDALELE